ncbi:NucA/NucB deoxyribonuclease domain-containing protein [Streptomyces sp. TLI_146]|uniref:NucA/NucB deoxyribonuclease domain-containing protein n=1 Tax=Streptomyces sp. TLI_146 TaxID=1938858 RepID=UPI000CB90692|nr:NucA/NucB deoxyribonuclease domain-containing protein [Streptomyces sp. TLI_146]PKV82909.1 deoxyribonuclease NucA/NucB [Streptomyces sp. TLI_146]
MNKQTELLKRRLTSGLLSLALVTAALITSAGAVQAQPPTSTKSAPTSTATAGCAHLRAALKTMKPGKAACMDKVAAVPDTAAVKHWQRSLTVAPGAVPCQLGQLALDRTSSCYEEFTTYRVIQVPGGEVLGTGTIGVASTTALDTESRTWRHNVRLGLLDATGVVAIGTTANVSLDCTTGTTGGNPPCTAVGGGVQSLPYPTTNVDYPFSVTSPNVTYPSWDQYTHSPTPILTVFNPAATEQAPPGRMSQAGQVRCDSTPYVSSRAGGCVYPAYTPTYSISVHDPLVDQVAWHILWAQQNLNNAWGVEGVGPALHRTTSRDVINANRRTACPRSRHRPPGTSCDEYPFASSYEGASRNADYSWHMVPRDQNSREGGSDYRLKFYRDNRVLDHDAFWVHIVR